MREIRILGISGSLRAVSSHRSLLAAAASIVPAGVVLEISSSIGNLPLFNPDLADAAPDSVLRFRAEIAAADAVLIASPEYAHGVTGAMKNALDWLVGSGEFSGKPIAALNASPRSFHAHESLLEILRTMDARVIPEASIRIPLSSSQATEQEISSDKRLIGLLGEAVMALIEAAGRQG
ncbi:MAG: NADPH-dependent FMN reductase [Luteolibacter sp.]